MKALAGRGRDTHIIVNSATGKLGDSAFSIHDTAAHICPVGAILPKEVGFVVPIGERIYDHETIAQVSVAQVALIEGEK